MQAVTEGVGHRNPQLGVLWRGGERPALGEAGGGERAAAAQQRGGVGPRAHLVRARVRVRLRVRVRVRSGWHLVELGVVTQPLGPAAHQLHLR